MRNTLGFLFVGAMLASAATMVGCGGDTAATSDDMGSGGPDLAMAANPCGVSALCTQSVIADQSFNLSENGQATFDILGAPDYSGTVNLSVDRTAIDSMSGGKSPFVGIAVVPGSFQMVPGVKKTIFVKFSTTTDAAAFTGQTIKVHVADATDATKSFDVPFKLTVVPQLTITLDGTGMTGGTNVLHTWSTDTQSDPLTINVRARAVTGTGANSVGGTTFIFKNIDKTTAHEIHADAPLTHQATNGVSNVAPNPTSNQNTMAANGGIYQLNAVNDTKALAAQGGGFYCHNHQTGNMINGTRNVRFIP